MTLNVHPNGDGDGGDTFTAPAIGVLAAPFVATAAFTDVVSMNYTSLTPLSALAIYASMMGIKTANTGNGFMRILVDGVEIAQTSQSATAGFAVSIGDFGLVNVAAGAHVIKLQSKYNTIGFTITPANGDEHARLLVQEVSR